MAKNGFATKVERNGERGREWPSRHDSHKTLSKGTVRLKYKAGGIIEQDLVVAAKAVANGEAWPIDHLGKKLPVKKVVICRLKGKRPSAGSPVVVIDPGEEHRVYLFPKSLGRIQTVPKDSCLPVETCAHAHPAGCTGCHNNHTKKK